MQRLVVRQLSHHPEPHALRSLALDRMQEIRRIDCTELEWPLLAEEALHFLGHAVHELGVDLAEVAQLFRRRRGRHRRLVIETGSVIWNDDDMSGSAGRAGSRPRGAW